MSSQKKQARMGHEKVPQPRCRKIPSWVLRAVGMRQRGPKSVMGGLSWADVQRIAREQ